MKELEVVVVGEEELVSNGDDGVRDGDVVGWW